jgi:hypothetical protein
MDKKKVKELIQEVIRNNVDSLEFGNDKHNAPLRKANGLLHDALIELGKSDWVSVEDGLPEYGESVLVTNKDAPEIVLKTSRTKCKGWNTDKNEFLCAVAFNITQWKPIEKLEE